MKNIYNNMYKKVNNFNNLNKNNRNNLKQHLESILKKIMNRKFQNKNLKKYIK